jgi:hypothetical protein
MAGVRDDDLRGAGPWPLGINNVAKEDRLPSNEDGRPVALREADNVDLDAAGVPTRRPGRERFYSGLLTHSAWSDVRFPFALFVDNGVLHAVDTAGGIQSLGFSVGHRDVSYAVINDRVFFSNRVVSGLVDVDLQVWSWAPEQPAGQPEARAVAGLGLSAGRYQVAVTFVDALGRESGSTLAVPVEVVEGQGIELDQIPQPLEAVRIHVYITDANDQVLRLHSKVGPGVTSMEIGQQAQGRALGEDLQMLTPLPAGQIVGLLNGRQFVADGQHLRWSPPMRYGLTNRAKHVLRFAAPIDLFAPAGEGKSAGVFVAAGSRTHWLAGADPAEWSNNIKKSSGAIPGSYRRLPGAAVGMPDAEDVPVWIARDGQYCVGTAGGVIVTPKHGHAVVNNADRAATMFREVDGVQQLVTAMRGPRAQALAVRDEVIAHVLYDGR